MPEVHLADIGHLGGFQEVLTARDLSKARKATTGLEDELPLPADGYSSFLKSYRRLGRIKDKAKEARLSAFAITIDKGRAIGMATIQATGVPKPASEDSDRDVYRLEPADTFGAEVSYWHKDLHSREAAFDVGVQVMSLLIDGRFVIPNTPRIRNIWTVTLPDDSVKAQACELLAFTPYSEPQRYDIGDQVTVDRQLWVRNLDPISA